jgi:hypothetical protein
VADLRKDKIAGGDPSMAGTPHNPSIPRSETCGPKRVQRKRTKGWTRGDAACVDRSSRFGNPFAAYRDLDGWRIHILHVTDGRFPEIAAHDTKPEAIITAVRLFEAWLKGDLFVNGLEVRQRWILANLHVLRGRDLACYCAVPDEGEDDWCHAAVLISLANGGKQ